MNEPTVLMADMIGRVLIIEALRVLVWGVMLTGVALVHAVAVTVLKKRLR